ncbi:MAG: helix-turn-helix domain-containing protein [Oscillospiraceae bacterium]|nr:helix-turn-helix domain-containing protein [Oscillospiraceae bacterium]
MPRAIVTNELAETLRNIRLQNKIQSKLLAKHINKSPAFISKLESGNIQTIDTKELYSILQFISGENDSTELAERIYNSLKIKCTSKEIDEQLWFVNYDTVECLIPIPETLVDYINELLTRLNITRSYLHSRINANEALSQEENDDESIEYNHWYHKKNAEDNAQSIKIKLSEKKINDILDKKIDISPYVFIFCILFYTLKIEKHGNRADISDDENRELYKETTELLNSHKFLSISEKNNIIMEKETQEEVQELLSSFDNTNREIISDIISGFRFASDHNIKTTNKYLEMFSDNMHWDIGFMLRLISLNFKIMEKTSFNNKKALLNEIEKLISEYANLSDQCNIEEY